MSLRITEEMRHAMGDKEVVEVQDDTGKVYYLITKQQYELYQSLEHDIDPSLYEFEDAELTE